MTDEFTIQCPECGTHYNDLQEVCPYCGAPQPATAPETPQHILIEPPEPGFTPVAPALSDVPPRQEDHLFANDDIFAIVGEDETAAAPDSGLPAAPPDDYFNDSLYPEEPYPPAEAYYPAQEEEAWTQPGYDSAEAWDEELVPPRAADEGWPDEAYFDEPPEEDAPEGFVMPFGTPADTPLPMPQPAFAPDGSDLYPPDGADDFAAPELSDDAPVGSRRIPWRRFTLGCLGIVACVALLYGGIGLMAVRAGLQERALLANSESLAHYRRGQELLAEDSIDLAIAEFERAIKLNPTFREARQALREAQQVSLAQPTPTSETRTAAAADIFAQAEAQLAAENWSDAIFTLSQVRDLDSAFQPEQVAELMFTAHYQRGLQLLRPDQLAEALTEFEAALAERPTDPDATTERRKAALYLTATDPDVDLKDAVRALVQLQRLDDSYLDVSQLLPRTYHAYGDELGRSGEWCLAQAQFAAALELQPGTTLASKLETSTDRCLAGDGAQPVQTTATPPAGRTPSARGSATPAAGAASAAGTPPSSATTPPDAAQPQDSAAEAEPAPAAPSGGAGGRVVYATFNPDFKRWDVLAVPAAGGEPTLLAASGIMPALSPNGQTLLYRSEQQSSIGIHALNLATGEDVRATKLRQDVLPRWGGENNPFIFAAQDPGTNRWEIFLGFADGKSDPINQGDGRTPTWSRDGKFIAFQGTDAEGNNPGIYVMPFGGGAPVRLTSHESDRSPAFSPDGSQVAYMSTRGGNWDVYVVSSSGGEPRQVTTTPGNDGLPTWSPDGTRLAYVSDSGGRWGIFTIGSSGGAPARITDWDGVNRADWLQSQIWWGP